MIKIPSLTSFFIGVSTTFSFIIIFLVIWLIKKHREKVKINLSFNYALLLIEIPKYIQIQTSSTEPRLKIIEELTNFENFLNVISQIKKPTVFEIALPHVGEEIFFFIAVPRKYTEFVQKAIKGFWPGAEVTVYKTDYNVFNPEGFSIGSYVILKNHNYLPIKTYQQISQANIDPLDAFLSAFDKLSRVGEGLSYQIILNPLPPSYNKAIYERIKELRKGKKLKEVLEGESWGELFKNALKTLFSPESLKETFEPLTTSPSSQIEQKKKKEEMEPKPIEETSIKILESKASKPLFQVNIRLIASAPDEFSVEKIISNIESAFNQFINPPFNEFKIIRPKRSALKKLLYEFSFRIFNPKQSSILNTEEITSIFHFPTSYNKNPIIHWLKSRNAPPPPNLPREGIILGKNVYQGEETIIRIKRDDRRRHMYIIGQTGTGKTTLLKNMIEQDIKNGDGVCFLDPHGDVAQEVLSLIPKERFDDVIYFYPGYTARPIGFNILEYNKKRPEDKTRIINMIIEIIGKLYNLELTGGPMFEQYLRNSLLLLMDNPDWGYTLLDVSRVLVDEEFREDLISKCTNYPVVEFWVKQATLARRELALEEMVTWITSKLNPFITNDFIRPIIAQSKSTINFEDIINNKKIFIANLSKGLLGETSCYLLGMLLITKILIAAYGRSEIPESERKDFYLYVDEFQNFAFDSVAGILSEARKFRLSMIFAHQYIKQLPEKIYNAVFGNVGTLITFRIGVEDAEFLEKAFMPVFSKIDLVNIPNYNVYLRLMIDGYISQPFSMQTLPPNKGDFNQISKLVEYSALKYGRPIEEINKELIEKYGYITQTSFL